MEIESTLAQVVGAKQPGIHKSPKSTWTPDAVEMRLVGLSLILGFLFIRWLFFSFIGFGVTLFSLAFIGTTIYAFKDQASYKRADAIIWLGILFLLSLSYATFYNAVLSPFKHILMIFLASYAVLAASGHRIEAKADVWVGVDLFYALIRLPFENLIGLVKAIASKRTHRLGHTGQAINIIVGFVGISFALILIVPLLLAIDTGGFSEAFNQILDLNFWPNIDFEYNFANLILGMPVAAYFYGLFIGARHYDEWYKIDEVGRLKLVNRWRILAPLSGKIVVVGVVLLYVVFIITQMSYYISALRGILPEGASSYASYARSGFFELVKITLLNLMMIITGTIVLKREDMAPKDRWFFRLTIKIVCFITLFFIITAFAKMYLYIQVYGLTLRRLMPSLFMTWLGFVLILTVISPTKAIRRSIILGAVMIVIISNLNITGMVVEYNVNRYLMGSLESLDMDIFRQAGSGGVETAIGLYDILEDGVVKKELTLYLLSQDDHLKIYAGTPSDTLGDWMARHKLLLVHESIW